MHRSLLAPLPITRKTGHVRFVGTSKPKTLLDFWRWYASSLLDNGLRAGIAEFVVARAVGDRSRVRCAWASHDVTSREGIRVEVKSTCAVQIWKQRKPSPPIFTIRPSRAWSQAEGMSDAAPGHNSDVFVFCQLQFGGSKPPDPLDLRRWSFFVLPTTVLTARAPQAKTVALRKIRKWGAVEVGYGGLAAKVRDAAASASTRRCRGTRPTAGAPAPQGAGARVDRSPPC